MWAGQAFPASLEACIVLECHDVDIYCTKPNDSWGIVYTMN